MKDIFYRLLKLFFALCVFVSPLFFVTNYMLNPFYAQNLILAAATAGVLVLFGVYLAREKQINFTFNKADFAFILFIFACGLSVAYNFFVSPIAAAIINEAMRVGLLLLTSCAAGYFMGRAAKPYGGAEKEHKIPWLLYVWAALWLFYPAFRAQGFFDIYAIILWCAGIFWCCKYLAAFDAKEFADILLAVGGLAAVYGILQNLGLDIFWKTDISADFGARAISTFGNPNFLSSFLTLLLPIALVYFLSVKDGALKLYYFALVVVYAAFMTVSQARSSWFGGAAGIAVLFFFSDFRALLKTNKKTFIFVALSALFVFALWPQQGKNYASSALQRAAQLPIARTTQDLTLKASAAAVNQSYHQRLMMWTCGLKTAAASPVFGGGWGSFQLTHSLCQGGLILDNPALAPLLTQANGAHNEFIGVLSQSGLLGFALYMAFFVLSFKLLRANFKNFNVKQRLFYGALFAGLCAMLADNMLNITMQAAVTAFLFWFALGMLNGAGERKSIKINAPAAFVLCALCALGGAGMLGRQIYATAAEVRYFAAMKAYTRQDWPLAKELAQSSINLYGLKAESYYTLAGTLVKMGENDKAQEVADKAARLFPGFYEFSFLEGNLALNSKDAARAAQYFKRTLQLNPSNGVAAVSFAQLTAQERSLQTKENIEFLTRLCSTAAGRTLKYYLAQIFETQGNYQQAAKLAREELAADNFNTAFALMLKRINAAQGKAQDELLQKAEKLAEYKNLLKSSAAPSAQTRGKIEAAAAAYPQDFSAQILLAELYFRTEDYPKAKEVLEQLYKKHAYELSLNFALSSLYSATGEKAKQAFFLKQIIALDPLNQTARQRLAQINLDTSLKNSLQTPLN